jgi:hypothetical protein
MIKITCTQEEKDEIVKLFDTSDVCIFPKKIKQCTDRKESCHDCFDFEIEWEIIDQ